MWKIQKKARVELIGNNLYLTNLTIEPERKPLKLSPPRKPYWEQFEEDREKLRRHLKRLRKPKI